MHNRDAPAGADLEQWLQQRAAMVPVIKQHLEHAIQRMTHQANKKRPERTFQVGDWVYLRLQPYVQQSLMPRSCHKLSFRYYGPYQVLQKVGNVSYKLQLPAHSKIHLVVHVSLLKKAVKNSAEVSMELPASLIDLATPIQPAAILGERLVKKGKKLQPQVRVRWSTLPDDHDTWENVYALVNAFPKALAWGQAVFSGGGIVTTDHLGRALKAKRRELGRQSIRETHQEKVDQAQPTPATQTPAPDMRRDLGEKEIIK